MRSLIIYLLFSISYLTASDKTIIDLKKKILQVGAFNNQKSLSKLQKKLSKYNLLTKKVDNFNKLYVLNPTKQDIKYIKKIIPSAFLLSKIAQEKIMLKDTNETPIIKINLPTSNKGLNTQTIIQTRKKFFK